MISCKTVLCSYNGEKYITEQVLSIEHAFKFAGVNDYSIVVFDDGSIDGTCQKIQQLQSQFLVGQLTYHSDRNKGVVKNFIQAILSMDVDELDWLFLADQDDVWREDKVAEYFSVFEKTSVDIATIVFSDAVLIDEYGKEFSPSFFNYQGLDCNILKDDSILFRNCVQGATIALNKEMILLLRNTLEYINIQQIVMHDWWLAILAKYYGQYYFLNKPLIKYRQHSNNKVGAQGKNKFVTFVKSPKQFISSFIRIVHQANAFISMDAIINPERIIHHKRQFSLKNCGWIKKFLVSLFKITFFNKSFKLW